MDDMIWMIMMIMIMMMIRMMMMMMMCLYVRVCVCACMYVCFQRQLDETQDGGKGSRQITPKGMGVEGMWPVDRFGDDIAPGFGGGRGLGSAASASVSGRG
jgi:hypothetical protein